MKAWGAASPPRPLAWRFVSATGFHFVESQVERGVFGRQTVPRVGFVERVGEGGGDKLTAGILYSTNCSTGGVCRNGREDGGGDKPIF